MTGETALLHARGITKQFGPNMVLNGVDFALAPGSVHVLMGENGAGKSTLIKILCGIHQPNAGEIAVAGKPISIANPKTASRAGIRVVHQEFTLVPALSVAENIHLGALPTKGVAGVRIDRKAMRDAAQKHLATLGADISPDRRVESLAVAERQLVEIARALAGNAQIIILDEPTAALSAGEVERLLATIERLKTRGMGIVYVSHRMEEVRRVGDQVSVLRDGSMVLCSRMDSVTNEQLIEAMIGRKLDEQYPVRQVRIGEPVLELDQLSSPGAFERVSLSVRAGEIVGVVGPIGCGLIELGHAVFGALPTSSGKISVRGWSAKRRTPRSAMRAGMAFVPEDRKQSGLMLRSSVSSNASAAIIEKLTPFGAPLALRKERRLVRGLIDKLKIVTPGASAAVRLLSGGNQQKVVLGRWLLRDTRVFILSEPTRGVDVGAKEAIYRQMGELVEGGAGILLLTSDLMEAIGMCDRLLVMRRGAIVAELPRAELNMRNVLSALYSDRADVQTH